MNALIRAAENSTTPSPRTPPLPVPRVLVVDDREENLEAMRAVLDDDGSWQLLCVNSGEAALQCLLHDDISLVLLDVQMPGMDGYEVAELMHGNPRTRHTPIIFVSAIARTPELILRGYNTGAVDFILKPFDPAMLRQKVHNLLAYENNRRELQRLSQQLERERAFSVSILANAAEGIMVVGEDGLIQYANPAMVQMLGDEKAGNTANNLQGRAFLELLAASDAPQQDWTLSPFYQHWRKRQTYRQHEAALITASNAPLPVSLSCAPLPQPQRAMVILVRDISVEYNLHKQLESLIIADPLTGLLNRRGFLQAVEAALSRARRGDRKLALLYLDLDGFKAINDTLGHNAGDDLLYRISAKLRSGVRAYDSLARMGGDEFTILLDNLHSCNDAAKVAAKLLELVASEQRIGEMTFNLSASVGIACWPDCGDDVESLISAADMAMYEVKQNGRQHYRFYSPQMTANVHARIHLDQRLREAIDKQYFELLWQPQYCLDSGQLRGFEALLRWPRGNPDKLGPDQFISRLEETGLIHPLGKWVLNEGIGQLARLNQHFGAATTLSLNISPAQFAIPELIEELAQLLHSHNVPATQLELEVTESVLLKNLNTTQSQLRLLRELGIKIAVDDFGTGYSSLAYLSQFDLDVLKIDRLFITNMMASPRDAALVKTIIDLGEHLGLDIIAEGVETQAQRQWLLEQVEHGKAIMQGWLVSPALPFEAALKAPRQLDWGQVPLTLA